MRGKECFVLFARALLGGVLIYAGYIKLIEPAENFAAALENYRLIPHRLLVPSAYLFPWIEYILGGFLLTGFLTRISAVGAMGMLSFFLLTLGITVARGIDLVSCGCFGISGPHLSTVQEFILDIFLLGLAWFIFKAKEHPISLDSWITHSE
ncbi:MAG: DoxX family membrane protein [Elusimicrobia bacterium]|nr:DoxX family membrane protein [Elusimicrobiota bacterium]